MVPIRNASPMEQGPFLCLPEERIASQTDVAEEMIIEPQQLPEPPSFASPPDMPSDYAPQF